ncbi:MAG: tRNA lysidine(34) synthetase TilS [Clostridia bacterium]|nr:tRNA lysidine(34) synthetase TilS [Clostridia bacterium]
MMLNKIKDAISLFCLLNNAKHITVALSGGADSMALLGALLSLKEELGITKITAAHFNHQIRGLEAQRDQEFVQNWCVAHNVELYLGSADVPQYASDNNLSVELAARKLRYQFFDTLDTDLIATAHTASDNIETVLFNLTRGTALSGLCGIPPKRDRYIRPLIFCTRADIEDYCESSGIQYVTDSTNLCDDYTRNKIRHNIVPVLKQLNPSAEAAVTRMTASLREDNDFINGFVQGEHKARNQNGQLLLKDFDSLHTAVAKRLIVQHCQSCSIVTDNLHINQIYDICLSGGKVSLPDNMSAISKNGVLIFESAQKQTENINFTVDIQKTDNDLFENCQKVHNLLLKNILDCDKIVGQLVLRQRLSGDAIRLKNKNCTKTLKKLFCEYKIPVAQRTSWPILADDDGIVWIYKIGVADRCAADKDSKKIYKISVK